MLIITRKISESIDIGNDVRIDIMSVRGNQVRIGIHAPKGVPVRRTELEVRATARDGESSSDSARTHA